jgi:hypothetical protein
MYHLIEYEYRDDNRHISINSFSTEEDALTEMFNNARDLFILPYDNDVERETEIKNAINEQKKCYKTTYSRKGEFYTSWLTDSIGYIELDDESFDQVEQFWDKFD